MYRIMIVDDEPVARKGLIGLVDWSSLECEIVCEANDGIDACDMLKSCSVDIIITDIKMPGMGGIELSEYIYKNFPFIKVIILTGYADFSFAQAAIRYNVVDFVLKPILAEKIINAVTKAKELITQQKEEKNKLRALENTVNDNLIEMREKLFQDVINGILIEPPMIFMKMWKLDISLVNFFIIVLEIDKTSDKTIKFSPESQHRFTAAVKNLTSLAFKDLQHYNVFISRQLLCTILDFKSSDAAECMQTIFTTCEKILEMVDNFMEFRLSIGISNMHSNPVEVLPAYNEAFEALTNKFYNDSTTSIFIPYTQRNYASESAITNNYIDKIIYHIENGNCRDALSYVNEFLEIQRTSKQPIEFIKNVGIQLCTFCSKLLSNHNLNLSKIVENGDNIYKAILQSKSITHLSEILNKVVREVSLRLSSSERQNNYIINKTIDYIKSNYARNINLQLIADHVHVNSSYLSRLFRKETNETVIEFITRLRMEKAKELLKKSNVQIYEVASLVGIDNATYFSQIFKKYTGVSPKEYKYSNML